MIEKTLHLFGRVADGTASTGDVICRLFGTTVTTVAVGQSSMFAPNLPIPAHSLISRVQARRDRPTQWPAHGWWCGHELVKYGWCCMHTTHPTLVVSYASGWEDDLVERDFGYSVWSLATIEINYFVSHNSSGKWIYCSTRLYKYSQIMAL